MIADEIGEVFGNHLPTTDCHGQSKRSSPVSPADQPEKKLKLQCNIDILPSPDIFDFELENNENNLMSDNENCIDMCPIANGQNDQNLTELTKMQNLFNSLTDSPIERINITELMPALVTQPNQSVFTELPVDELIEAHTKFQDGITQLIAEVHHSL